uniref:Vitelline membrane outer layer protein 1-like n=1 Tax=Cyprinus carpio TaxID=7962 RepID=A0A8C1QV72_CYPCA
MHHFISLLLVIIGLHVSVQTAISVEDLYALHAGNGMSWGWWRFADRCPNGTYAAGFSIRVEEISYGFWDDNTALNGIRLHCVDPSKGLSRSYEDYASVQSDVGSWGQWKKIQWCPFGFLTAFQLRVESPQGIEDDSAVNNIRFRCSGGSLLQGDGTFRGNWGEWTSTCEGRGICGIKTRIEEPQGYSDDTALNDVRMYCCD